MDSSNGFVSSLRTVSHTPVRLFTCFRFAFLILAPAFAQAADPGLKIGVAEQVLHFRWAQPKTGRVEIRELPLHTAADLSRETRTLTVADATAGAAEVPRFDGARDRLYAKFQLADATTHQPLGDAQCVTDFSALPARTQSLKRPDTKKGLGCIVDQDDFAATGAAWAKQDIDIASLLDCSNPAPSLSFDFEGRKVGLRRSAVTALDAAVKGLNERGAAVVGVLLNYVKKPKGADQGSVGSPLVHPLTPVKDTPTGVVAFNTATAEGLLLYRAITHWIIDRYTDPAEPHGRMTGLVIGNEVQSHWAWYNLGETSDAVVIREYSAALRTADLAARSVHPDFRIYISMEHHWTLRGDSDDGAREMPGIVLLRGLAAQAKREGDFPWHLAFHPYPESLFDARFWNDKTAPLRPDAPRITFHNLEVLTAFLRQPEFLYQSQPRRIALTEQGFHRPKGADGETVQAAAFAYAWKRIQALPEIESFIYHRHVDHPNEGGLLLGLREHDATAPHTMGAKRIIWDTFQKAGTPGEDAAFAFALPIVGRKDWSNIVATQLDNSPAAPDRVTTGVLYDFVANRRAAQVENTLAFEFKRVLRDAGWMATALQQHPNQHGISRATWRVAVPAGQPCVLRFTALLNHAESKGAGFAVKIDGRTVFDKKLAGKESERAEIDLAPWAGKEAAFDFLIDPLDRNQFAWATWVEPRIALK